MSNKQHEFPSPARLAIAKAGGPSVVASALRITPQAVSLWINKGKIPAERVLDVEKLCGFFVTRSELRPDLYPPDTLPKGSRARNLKHKQSLTQ